MDKKNIIDKIINDNSFKSYCFFLCKGNDIYLDLYQTVILLILELPEDKLIEINNGNLKGYINRVAFTSYINKYSTFNKQITSIGEDLTFDLTEDISNDYDEEKMFNAIDLALKDERQYWDNRGQPAWTIYLFNEYLKYSNFLELSRKTNIPYPTIRYNIKKLIKKINENLINNRQ
jgi:hypothetical protein